MNDNKPGPGEHLAGRTVPTLLYLAWSAAFFWLLAEDGYLVFLQPMFWPLVVLGAVLSAMFMVAAFFRKPPETARAEPWLRALVLLLPLLFLLHAQEQSLGSHALALRSLQQGIPDFGATGGRALEGEDPESGSVDLLRLALGKERYDGKRVVTEGIVAAGGVAPQGYGMLFRFVIACCAADAQPVGLLVEGGGLSGLEEDSWARVSGRFEIRDVDGVSALVIVPETIEPIDAPPPSRRYLYFF